jgi:uncharacterized protein
MMTTSQATQLSTQARGIRFIDADTHLSEPHDLWTKRAPAKYKDRVPQVKMHNGRKSWVINGDISIGDGASPHSSILKDGRKVIGVEQYTSLTMEDVHPGSSQVRERLGYMDEHNIAAQIVYPNLLGFGGQKSAKVDQDLRLICTQIYNDAMADLQAESGQRIYGMGLLPWWNISAAVAETKRIAALGLRGVNINSDPHYHVGLDGKTLPDLGADYWNPLWEVCVSERLPVNFHIGASEQSLDLVGTSGWPGLSVELRGTVGSSMLFFNNSKTVANIICCGVLDRFPDLKFVSVESGIGWIPFLLESLDYQYREYVSGTPLKLMPSEYFQRNFFGCFWFERKDVSHVIREVGVDNVLFETDYPHPTCLYPIDDLASAFTGLSIEERTKVLYGNAAKLYRLNV